MNASVPKVGAPANRSEPHTYSQLSKEDVASKAKICKVGQWWGRRVPNRVNFDTM